MTLIMQFVYYRMVWKEYQECWAETDIETIVAYFKILPTLTAELGKFLSTSVWTYNNPARYSVCVEYLLSELLIWWLHAAVVVLLQVMWYFPPSFRFCLQCIFACMVGLWNAVSNLTTSYAICRVHEWLRTASGLVIGFTDLLQLVTKINSSATAIPHTLLFTIAHT
jgi:hypothetical protein